MRRARKFIMAVIFLAAVAGVLDPRSGYAIDLFDLQDLNVVTPTSLANQLMGPRATVTNVTYIGVNEAAGTFTNGLVDGIGIHQGIILTTGDIFNAVGPNTDSLVGLNNFQPGDAGLDLIVGTPPGTSDATILEFDFRTTARAVTFKFVLASDEYNEVTDPANPDFGNDVFALYINGVNVARTPRTNNPVTVNTINLNSNPALFNNNDPDSFFPLNTPFQTQYDGFTKVLRITVPVIPNFTHRIRLAIADEFEGEVDSAVFLAPAVSAVPNNDFDRDGLSDVAGLTVSGQIFYTTDLQNWFQVPGVLAQLVVGDFNGDGFSDLAGLADDGTIWATIDLQNWFQIPGVLNQLVVGDFDGNGSSDLAGLALNGSIWFTTNLLTWVNVPGALSQLVVGDFNGNGSSDLAGLAFDGTIWVTTNLGLTWVNVPGSLSQLVVGDFNGNGSSDLAGLASDGTIWLTTNLLTWVNVPGSLSQLIAGDFDVNGQSDLAGLASDGTIWLTTNLLTWVNVPGRLSQLITGDFDGIGQSELVGLASDGTIWLTSNLNNWTQVPGVLLELAE